jgi:MoaA/NifB/PqqE/SkfB family radical SAM enzyme
MLEDARRSFPARKVGAFSRLRYSPFLAQLVIIRRCNLSCRYCSEFDKTSEPIPTAVLVERLQRLKNLGTFGISLTGGEPTLHPDLPYLIRKCRDFHFFRTGMISNGLLLRPELIETLNKSGLQEMQISVDGVQGNDTTQKVLDNLKEQLEWLHRYARFRVVVSAVLGACPPQEAEEVVSFAKKMGFIPRVLLIHDNKGQLKLSSEEVNVFESIIRQLSNYRTRLVKNGVAPFKCRAGSRYLYIDEYGQVSWCSQTRKVWSKDLMGYTWADLREQFYRPKACHSTCTLGCVRSCSQLDNWRSQPGFTR